MTSPLPGYSDALAAALRLVSPLGEESVDLEIAADRILAEDIVADRDLPPFNRAMMDGYALRAGEYRGGEPMPVAATIAAGSPPSVDVPPDHCVKIATGAAVPEGLDAVVQHEFSDRGEPVTFTAASVEPGRAIHPRGADARSGDVVLPRGTRMEPHHLGIAASVGRARISVRRRPRVIILTSGDEVRPVDEPIERHQIRNSNGPMPRDLLRRFGAEVVRCGHVIDERNPTVDALRLAIDDSDLVVTVGGVSAGERDHFPAAYEACQVDMPLLGAAIQPGKPIHVGRAPTGAIVAGLPGNPVSALATGHLFIWPIVRAMRGIEAPLSWESRTLSDPVRPNPRRQAFRPAILHGNGTITVPTWAGSGDLVHTAPTHGLAALPVQADEIPARTAVEFLAWAP